MDIIPNKVYRAMVTGLSDTTDGKYKVYIPSLMAHDKTFQWCMARNKTSSYAKWSDPSSKKVYSSGSYLPLIIGMMVEVRFDTTDHSSCNIVGVVYDQSPLNKDDQENFYLFGKTKNGTMIYVDDSRNITHVMHNKGKSNIILMDDKISLSINEVSPVGNNNFSNIEVGAEAITMSVGATSLVLDESGMQVVTKDNKYHFGNKEIAYKTSKFSVEANTYEVQADKIYINGLDELHLKSTVTRVSGGQHLSLTGNVINVHSNVLTSISSNTSVHIKSNINMLIECTTHVKVDTGFLALRSMQTHISSEMTTISSSFFALSSSTIAMDGIITQNIGVGQVATAMDGVSLGLSTALYGIDYAYSTAFHFADGFSGMAANMISESLPGVAQGAPRPMPIPSMTPRFDYLNTIIKYMNTNIDIGNVGTIDNLNSLNGNLFLNVFRKKDNNE